MSGVQYIFCQPSTMLELARLVSTRKEGRSLRGSLVVDALSEAGEWIAPCRSSSKLDLLAERFESETRPHRTRPKCGRLRLWMGPSGEASRTETNDVRPSWIS